MDIVLDNSQQNLDDPATFKVPKPISSNENTTKTHLDVGPGGDAPVVPKEQNNESDTKAFVMKQFQNLLQEVDEKRKADEKIVSEFRNRMTAMLEDTFQQVEEKIQKTNEETNKQMKLKLHYLKESLDRVVSLEEELGNFKNAVGVLYQDIQHK